MSDSIKKFRADFDQPVASTNKKIELVTNHYHLEIPRCVVYHYDVKIDYGGFDGNLFNESSFYHGKSTKFYSDKSWSVMNKYIKQNQSSGGTFYDDNLQACLLPVFDGKQNLYTVRPIPSLGITKMAEKCEYIKLEDSSKFGYRIKIRFATKVDLEALSDYVNDNRSFKSADWYKRLPHDAVRALDIILRASSPVNHVPLGNCIFPKSENADSINIGCGKQVISGHYQSIRPTASGLSLIIDKSSTTFYNATDLVDFIRNLLKEIPGKQSVRNMDPLASISLASKEAKKTIENNLLFIEKELQGIKLEVTHTPQKMKFKVRKLTRTSVKETYFTLNGFEDKKISVYDFFLEKYKIKISYLHLPCVVVGNAKRPSYLPLEVCQVVKNQRTKALSQKERISFIKSSSQDCDRRFEVINDGALSIKKANTNYLNEFSLDLSEKPIQVDGLCLDRPKIYYKDNFFTPDAGKWNMCDKKIVKGCKVDDCRWFIVNLSKLTEDVVKRFISLLISFGNDKGASIGQPEYWNDGHYECKSVERILKSIHKKHYNKEIRRPKLIMFIITRVKDDSIYHEIKQSGDVEFGFNTQCVVDSNVRSAIKDKGFFILANIFLKMNAKLGGINNVIGVDTTLKGILGKQATIIMGADVTHPTDKMSYSIAACVASLDENQTQYAASVRVQQRSNEEIILDLPDMVYELLNTYVNKNMKTDSKSVDNILPERLIFYRDGVSDGQFSKVMEKEIERMPEAFEKISKKFGLKVSYRPKVTFIVVQKRHHTRLKPLNPDDSEGKAKNVPSGTLVTQKIVSTNNGSDFFLCSHSSSLGTSKPSHYYVLVDDNNFDSGVLYSLTFSLCYIYAKCTRVISIPAPVQYAHLAAFRARQHLVNTDKRRYSSDPESERKEIEKSIKIHHRLTSDFYFI
ncbi:protein argonaute-2 [Tetranychus urticae]|uniref:Uncharacterized protein n=1 Tax=Tetranychus urticae TaxID=32264 RepID=T1KCV4_TETUR|nr:protein argonaute-2 [Tetranychus urticae]